MTELPKLIEVKATKPFTLYLKFNDGTEGEVDLSGIERKGVFAVWNEAGEFEKVYLGECNVPTWKEDLDIDAHNQYLKIKNISFEQYLKISHA